MCMLTVFMHRIATNFNEPMLSTHLTQRYHMYEDKTPLFFLLNSVGLGIASLLLAKTSMASWSPNLLIGAGFILTGLCSLAMVEPGLSYFSLGFIFFFFFLNLTLLPVFRRLTSALEDSFDLSKVS